MKNKTTALAALLVVASAFTPAHADAPVTPLAAEKPMIEVGAFENIAVVDLLKVVAKSFNADVTINSDVSGTINFFRVRGRSAKEVLESIAKVARLTVTEKDGAFLVSKKVGVFYFIKPKPASIALPSNISDENFRIGLSMEPRPDYAVRTLDAKLKLQVKPGTPEVEVAWREDALQPSLIALKDNSWVPLLKRPIAVQVMPNPVRTQTRSWWSSFVAEDRPLSLSFDLGQWLEKPLEPGRYLCFVTYKSQSPNALLLDDIPFWEGQLVSNAVEFEVQAPPSGRI